MSKVLILALMGLFFCSCGELAGSGTGANSIDKYIGSKGILGLGGDRYLLEGTSDNGGDSSHNYRLKFKLPEGKSLRFRFFSGNKLEEGLTLTFSRVGTSLQLRSQIRSVGHSWNLMDSNNDEFDISVDVHNDHSDLHLLVWNGIGPYNDSDDCSFHDTPKDQRCLYNNEDFVENVLDPDLAPWGGHGKASGTFWGFEGDRDLIIELTGPSTAISNA